MMVAPATVNSILVYLDGTALGESGLGYALSVAQATGAEIILLDVVDTPRQPHPRPVDALSVEVARTEAMRYLHSVAARLSGQGPKDSNQPSTLIRTETAEGSPAEQILHVADREQVDLIVLASHQTPERERLRIGSTAQKVTQHATQSLLLVRADAEAESSHRRPLERVLVLLDGSSAAESSLPSALELARSLGTEIVLAHALVRSVLPTCEPATRADSELLNQLMERSRELAKAYLRTVEHRIRSEGVYCRGVIKECESIRQGVLTVSDEEDVDIILMTSHGHTLSELVLHGGVTQQILLHSKRPVWVVQNLHVASLHPPATVRSEEVVAQMSGSH